MVNISETKCIGCGSCIEDCIARCITLENGKAIAQGDCLLCGHCVAICPVNAVSIPDYDMEDVEELSSDTLALTPETLLHTIKARRSIRNYTKKQVEIEKLHLIAQAGRYTATAKNNQNCHFIFVQDELDTLKKQVWDFIDNLVTEQGTKLPKELLPFASFNKARKKHAEHDFLFRNAPAVLYITSDWPLDAGLAAQNMELMASAQGLGMLYNGYLARISDANDGLKSWLGIEGQTIKACMLLGYPNVHYKRTAPRKPANIIIK